MSNTDEIIYFVECDSDKTVLLAMNIEIFENTKIISWFDTIRNRRFKYSKIANEKQKIIVYRNDTDIEKTYLLRPLTVDIYNEKVKSNLINPIEIENIEDLIVNIAKK